MGQHHKETKGIINRRVVVDCPHQSKEISISFDPEDVCPLCYEEVDWE